MLFWPTIRIGDLLMCVAKARVEDCFEWLLSIELRDVAVFVDFFDQSSVYHVFGLSHFGFYRFDGIHDRLDALDLGNRALAQGSGDPGIAVFRSFDAFLLEHG